MGYTLLIISEVSGITLNKNKTNAFCIGKNKNRIEKPCDLNWVNEPIKILGIYVGYNKKECEILNWENKLSNLEMLLNKWKARNLTLFGKVTILKSLALSKLTYNASIIDVPEDIVNKINKLTYDFIWNGKREKIKRKTLIGNIIETCPISHYT